MNIKPVRVVIYLVKPLLSLSAGFVLQPGADIKKNKHSTHDRQDIKATIKNTHTRKHTHCVLIRLNKMHKC